jgi:hypothetical protein
MGKPVSTGLKVLAVFAFVFGVITVAKAGNILFGPQSARDAVGDFVPYVVKFNLVAGFFYLLAAVGIWTGRIWALRVSGFIALATMVTAAFFAWHVFSGGAYEMQTVGALILRAGFWMVAALFLLRSRAGV